MIGLTRPSLALVGLPKQVTVISHSFLMSKNRLPKSVTVIMAGFIVLFALSGYEKARAQTRYSRGIWYDVAGIIPKYLKNNEEVKHYQRFGISRIHIMVSHKSEEMGRVCDCANENKIPNCEARKDPAAFLRGLPKGQKTVVGTCAAMRHVFNFDKWPGKKYALLGRFVDQLTEANFRVIITIWPEPTKKYISSLGRLKRWIDDGKTKRKIYGIELEDEDNWQRDYTDFDNLSAAADALFRTLRDMLPETLIGVTATSGDFDAKKLSEDQLLKNADFISLQTYENVCTPYPNCHLDRMSGELTPGVFQQNALEAVKNSGVLKQRYSKARNKLLIVGLPDYDMDADRNRMGELNMYEAERVTICKAKNDPAVSALLIGNSYWSARNIARSTPRGRRHLKYAEPFFKNCSVEEIEKRCLDGDAVKYDAAAKSEGIESQRAKFKKVCPTRPQ